MSRPLPRLRLPAAHRLPLLVSIGVGLAPWTWFAWRDWGGGLDGPALLQVPLDLVSLFLPAIGALGSAALVVLAIRKVKWRWLMAASISWIAFVPAGSMAAWPAVDQPRSTLGLRVVHANLLAGNSSPGAVASLPLGDADVVVTSETNSRLYIELGERLGAPLVSAGDPGPCTIDGPGDCGALNVWSRRPARVAGDQSAAAAARGVRVEITGPAGVVVLYAVHPEPPSILPLGAGLTTPWSHRSVLARLLRAIEAEEDPVILVGDLNLSDRQSGYRDLTGPLDDALRSSRAGPTARKWFLRPLLLRLDHLLVPEGWCSADARRFRVAGSDHLGVTALVGPCPPNR